MILRKEGKKCSDLSKLCQSQNGKEFIGEYFKEIPEPNKKCILRIIDDTGIQCEHYFDYRIDDFYKSQLRIVHNKCNPVNAAYFGIGIAVFILLLGLIFIIIVKTTFIINVKLKLFPLFVAI